MGLHAHRALTALSVAVLVCTGAACTPSPETEPVKAPVRKAPIVRGIDQHGKQFSSESLKGKPWIASFFFATCQTVCPILNKEVAALQAESGPEMSFVSITTDPDNDTPEVMNTYAQAYDAGKNWHFVNMPTDSVRSISTKGFGVMDPQTPEMHSTRMVLVDGDGMIREYIDCEDSAAVSRLKRIVKTFIR